MEITDKKDRNRFFRYRKHLYDNFFYLINLSVDKVYNAKNIFWLATLYRKIDNNITFDFEDPGNIFNIKVCFLLNADMLDYGNDKF